MSHVYVVSTAGEPLALFDSYEECTWSRSYFEPGRIRFTIHQDQPHVAEIKRGRLLGPTETGVNSFDPDQVYLIEQIERELGTAGSSNELVTVTGRSVGGMMAERLILPQSGLAYDTRNGSAESVMKGFIQANASTSAASERQIPGFFVGADLARGISVTYQGRYQTLQEMLNELSLLSGLGWEVTFNAGRGEFMFDVLTGEDKTQAVVFDVELDTLREQRFLSNDLGRKTYSYVGGRGEGASRTIEAQGYPQATPSGFDRRELWVDAADIDDTAALRQRGETELLNSRAADIHEIAVAENSPVRYRTDWDLSDFVTVRNEKWGIEASVQIVAVELSFQPRQGEMTITVSFDRVWPSLADRLAQISRQLGVRRQ